MKNLKYGALFLAIVGIGFASCEKEDIVSENSDKISGIKVRNDIPSFDNREDFNNHIGKLTEMSEDDRRIFEKSQGFKSLLTVCYEVYEGIDMEAIASQAELEAYIAKNSSQLCLRPNSNMELEYNAFYADNHYAIVANVDRMFSIGDLSYKVFDDGIATTHKSNLSQLLTIDEIFAKNIVEMDQITISLYNTETIGDRSSCFIVDNNEEEDSNDGKKRTKIKIYSGYDNVANNNQVLWVKSFVRPYKKTLGIFYYAKRTTDASIDYSAHYDSNTSFLTRNNKYLSPLRTYKREDSPNESGAISRTIIQPYFDDIDSWGDTPDTDRAVIDCN